MISEKAKILRLLKTAQGQVQGLIKMVESERDCIEISTQILASQSILKKANLDILKGHFSHCIKESFEKGDETEISEKMEEVTQVLDKLLK